MAWRNAKNIPIEELNAQLEDDGYFGELTEDEMFHFMNSGGYFNHDSRLTVKWDGHSDEYYEDAFRNLTYWYENQTCKPDYKRLGAAQQEAEQSLT